MKRWLAMVLTAVLVWTGAGLRISRASEAAPEAAEEIAVTETAPEIVPDDLPVEAPVQEPAAQPELQSEEGTETLPPPTEEQEPPVPEAPEDLEPEPPAEPETPDEEAPAEEAVELPVEEAVELPEEMNDEDPAEPEEAPELPPEAEEPPEAEAIPIDVTDITKDLIVPEEPEEDAEIIDITDITDIDETPEETPEAGEAPEETTDTPAPEPEKMTPDEPLLDIGEDEIIAEFEAELEAILPDLNSDNAEELLNAYVEKLLAAAVRHPGLLRAIRVDGRLDEVGYALYQSLKPRIEAIAAGDQSSTVLSVGYADLGLPTRFTAAELGLDIQTTEDIYAGVDLVAQQLKVNYALVQLALLANCPYELYWYDKSTGARTTSTPGMRVRRVNGEYVYEITSDYTVRMTVSEDYSAETYAVDTSVGRKVRHSVSTAQQIVEKYHGLNDLEKLEAYRDEICRLVSYNGAAAGGGQAYGDPWQIVYVFDEDSGTNVVCEGYAKAFQYLCDMTDFDGDVNCYTVQGSMDWGTGEGAHMWNIVTMSDGQNYLVDLTNSDAGTLGADGSLFLTGDAEDADGALIFRNEKGQPIRYQYNADTTSLYTQEELTLSGKKYEVTCHLNLYPYHTLREVSAVPPTCEAPGRAAHWVCEQDGGLYADARGAEAVTEEDLVLPALGHAYGDWTVTTAPTCEEDGEERRVCAHDPAHAETRPVQKLGHQLTYVPAREPTYTAEGAVEHWVCETCGSLFADAEGTVPLSPEDIPVPKKKRPADSAQRLSAADISALTGWRIARIEELLSDEETAAFAALPLYDQLTVLASVLTGDARPAGSGPAAELAAQISAIPNRIESFRAVYPSVRRKLSIPFPSPAREVRLVSTADPSQTRLLLLAVQQNGQIQVAEIK